MTKVRWLALTVSTLALIAGVCVQGAIAGDLTVKEIVDRTEQVAYYQGEDGRAKVSMLITDTQGRNRHRQFTILRWDQPPPSEQAGNHYRGDQKYYVYFNRPADVNKMAFMVWKHVDKDDDRWLYLPALDLVKRIASQEKRTSFVGSHFFYEDVSGRDINADVHELVNTTENYYVLKNTPKEPEAAEFAQYTMWIHRSTFLPVKIEYFNDRGEKYREYEALKVETIQGFPTVIESRMKDMRIGGETLLQYRDVQYDIGLPEDIFTERYLRRPPVEHLR
ncbi:MAG: outer membrane lipoprotein-sorting protein [Deltaproteobacteria bacterium]